MREILFRGKRVDNGEWVEGWYGKQTFGAWPLKNAITPCVDAEDGYLHYEEIIPETVGQYTGLTDKNGKRIFEGDIVTFKTSVSTFKPCVVEYSNAETRFVARIGDIRYAMTDSFAYEVIGNVHDNPELIGGNGNDT